MIKLCVKILRQNDAVNFVFFHSKNKDQLNTQTEQNRRIFYSSAHCLFSYVFGHFSATAPEFDERIFFIALF